MSRAVRKVLKFAGDLVKQAPIRRVRRGTTLAGVPFPPKKNPEHPRDGISHEPRNGIFPLLKRARQSFTDTAVRTTWHPIVGAFEKKSRKITGLSEVQNRRVLRFAERVLQRTFK